MTASHTASSASGLSVAILLTDGFEQIELTGPRTALDAAGARSTLISLKSGRVQGFHHDVHGDSFKVDQTFDQAVAEDFDAVLLPGGALNADQLRIVPQAQRFVQAMQRDAKPIAVICHGAWLLVSAGLVRGRKLTSWPTLRDDICNAGGNWLDAEVVEDGNLVSSRKPDDIPAFNRHFIALLERRNAQRQGAPSKAAAISVPG